MQMEMPPWEQHAAVINMPRFLYSASTSLHQDSHTGFLITCPFRREKSATKEAVKLLQELCLCTETESGSDGTGRAPTEIVSGEEESRGSSSSELPEPKRLKSFSSKDAGICSGSGDGGDCKDPVVCSADPTCPIGKAANEVDVNEGLSQSEVPVEVQEAVSAKLMLVKLAKMGILFVAAPEMSSSSVISIVSKLLDDIQAGVRTPPQWCHRILPVQATCILDHDPLQELVSRLLKIYLKEHLSDPLTSEEQHLKYAVAFNSRGETDEKDGEPSFGKSQCINAAAEAVQRVLPSASVDLVAPQVAIAVEVLPLAGSRNSPVCAVSVLPGLLLDTKPRICMKPLIRPKNKRR